MLFKSYFETLQKIELKILMKNIIKTLKLYKQK